MSTFNSQNALHAALAARPPRPAVVWPTNQQILRALQRHDRSVIRALVDEPTGLGLAVRKNTLCGWTSRQFKINTPEQLAFDGHLLNILPTVEVPA
jgi:hypothetical protein